MYALGTKTLVLLVLKLQNRTPREFYSVDIDSSKPVLLIIFFIFPIIFTSNCFGFLKS